MHPRAWLSLSLIASVMMTAMPSQVSATPGPSTSRAKSTVLKTIPVAVFGSDERVALPPPLRPLRERMGVLFNIRHKTVCTAFCISPDIIGTAAHCLFKTKGEKRARLSDFWFARNYDATRDYARIAGIDTGSSAQSVVSGSVELSTRPPIDATKDWAFVKLATAVCRKGVFEIEARPVETIIQDARAGRIYQISYHKDFKQWQPAYSRPCSVERSFGSTPWPTIAADFDNPEHLVLHTCDTGGASSGSPLLAETPTGPKVVAINVGTYVQSRSVLHETPPDGAAFSDAVANTAVSATAFAKQLAAFRGARMLVTSAQLRELQEQLRKLALYLGAGDATYGPSLKTAIETYEKSIGLPPTGLATEEILLRLLQQKPGAAPGR